MKENPIMMKKLLSFVLVLATVQTAYSQFDQHLADSLGADEYGMKAYVIAFLKTGPNRTTDPEASATLMRGHMDNIQRMANEGTLVLAGPFFNDPENNELRGIYVFDVDSIEKARKLTETDPAIQSGHLVMELKKWYGTAALLMMKPYYDKISKKKI